MKRYCRKLIVKNNKGKPKNYMNMNVESQKKKTCGYGGELKR